MEPDRQDELQEALSRSASAMTGVRHSGDPHVSYEQDLATLTRAAVDNVPGADDVGLTMLTRRGELESHAATSREIAELDGLQVSLDEGPCRDAIRSGTTGITKVDDFSTDERWPRFGPAAAERGMLSLLSYVMASRGATPGAINFYSRRRKGFDDTSKVIAGAFAMQAAIAVYGADRNAQLEHALENRDVIGQAKGVLMERYRLDPTQAFARLVRASQDTNMKLIDVARWLTSETTRPLDG